jgi:hypothetical protein
MRVGSDIGSSLPTGWDGSQAAEAAGELEAAMALGWAESQHSHGVVPWSGFHVPDSALSTGIHDSRVALPHRAHEQSHHAQGGVFLRRADDPQDNARFHRLAAQSRSR